MSAKRRLSGLLVLILCPVLLHGDEPRDQDAGWSRPLDRPRIVFRALPPGDDGLGETRATPEYGAAYRQAVADADASLAEGRARLYSWGVLRISGLDPETGLGVMSLSGCVLTPEVLGRAEGNNRRVRAWIKQHGPPANSLLRWKGPLSDLAAYVAAREKAGAALPLRIGGPKLASPDGRFTIRQVAAKVERGMLPDVRTVTTVGLEVSERGVVRDVMTPYWDGDLLALAWGPPGAPFAVVKTRRKDGPDYFILHLRPLDWLCEIPSAEE